MADRGVSWGNASNQYGNRVPIRNHVGAYGQRPVNFSTLQRYPQPTGPYGNGYTTAQAWTTPGEKAKATAEYRQERQQAAQLGQSWYDAYGRGGTRSKKRHNKKKNNRRKTRRRS